MPMPPYQIPCYTKGCKHPAKYKIAGRWSDGVVHELKTYGLCCEECLPAWLLRGRDRQKACRLTAGETLEPPGVPEVPSNSSSVSGTVDFPGSVPTFGYGATT